MGPLAVMLGSDPVRPVDMVISWFGLPFEPKPYQPTLIARTSAARSSIGIVGSSPGLFTGRLRR